MFEQARIYASGSFGFLDGLDCYINTEFWMKQEIKEFEENPQRNIAALVCQNINQMLTYQAPYIRILYALSGDMELHINNEILNYSTGCLILANQWTEIKYAQTSGEMEVVSFLFKKDYFTEDLLAQMADDELLYHFFLENLTSNTPKSNFFVFQFLPEQDVHFFSLVLLKQVVKMNYKHNRIIRGAFLTLVNEINHLSGNHLMLKESTFSSELLTHSILADIRRSYKTVTLKSLASKYYFHPNYLSTFIREETGQTFSGWVQHHRLSNAKKYLEKTNMPIQQIIETVGYSDKAHFFRIFKREFGQTPNQYRTAFRQNLLA